MADPASDPNAWNPTTRISADVAVIGLGSGGEQLATLLADGGKRVVGFEAGRVGGECPFVACVPSKALLHDMDSGRSWPEAVARRDELTHHRDDEQHAEDVIGAGVDLRRERARIAGPHRVVGASVEVEAEHVVLATGSAPVRPDIPGADRPEVWVAADALSSEERPARLAVIGGGPIGCELSQVYRRFGAEVLLLDVDDRLLGDVEPEVASIVEAILADDGVDVRLGVTVQRLDHHDDGGGSTVHVDDTEWTADRVLLATGVTPRLDDLGLSRVGLDPRSVDIDRRGSVGGLDWLWAIGDTTPQSQWTHGATYQARALADRILGRTWPDPPSVFPRCVFIHPPVGAVGDPSPTLREAGHDVVVGVGSYEDAVRAATDELTRGEFRIVVDRSTGRILGSSGVGARADDLIQIVTALMVAEVDVATAAHMIFPSPTLSQVLEAAIDDAASELDAR